jgi:predicted ATPase
MKMHIKRALLFPEKYPTQESYPFNQEIFRKSRSFPFEAPVTLFVGENGTGKSTLLEAISHRCAIHIWRSLDRTPLVVNRYKEALYKFMRVEWTDGPVPGSFFASDIFRHFAQLLDEWASADPGQLDYFGGTSLMTQSHGQSLMSFFRSRYQIKGLYLLDEPETALSPGTQIELVRLIREMSRAGHAQFIVATHSPILLACPEAKILSFDHIPVKEIPYEETEHYRVYRAFMEDRDRYLGETRDT